MTSEIIKRRIELSGIPGMDPDLPVHPTFYMNLCGVLQLFVSYVVIERNTK